MRALSLNIFVKVQFRLTNRLLPMSEDLSDFLILFNAKSGFIALPLEIKKFPDFDPLIDAVAFGDRNITIHCEKDLTVTMLGSR